MRARSLAVVFTAFLFAGTMAFAQNDQNNANTGNNGSSASATAQTGQNGSQSTTDQNSSQSQSSQSATDQSQTGNAASPSADTTGNVMMGRVTKYTSGQSITVKTDKGRTHTWKLNDPNETANIDPSVKVGSRVKVSETNNNGQKTLNVEPASGSAAATTGMNNENNNAGQNASASASTNTQGNRGNLPRTASDAPLYGLMGLLSLAAAFGLRRARQNG